MVTLGVIIRYSFDPGLSDILDTLFTLIIGTSGSRFDLEALFFVVQSHLGSCLHKNVFKKTSLCFLFATITIEKSSSSLYIVVY